MRRRTKIRGRRVRRPSSTSGLARWRVGTGFICAATALLGCAAGGVVLFGTAGFASDTVGEFFGAGLGDLVENSPAGDAIKWFADTDVREAVREFGEQYELDLRPEHVHRAILRNLDEFEELGWTVGLEVGEN